MCIKIILVSGWSNAGKDTLADLFVENGDYIKLAYADTIKQNVSTQYNIPIEWCYDQEKKKSIIKDGKTLRYLLIEEGTNGRLINPNYWAYKIVDKIFELHQQGKNKFIISDWRFVEEFLCIQRELNNRDINLTIIPVQVIRKSQIVSPVPNISEYSLLGFPFYKVFNNDSTLLSLKYKVLDFINNE